MKRSVMDTKKTVIAKNIVSFFLFLYTSIAVVLIANAVLSSFKTKADLINNTMGFPKSFTLDNFKAVLFKDKFGLYFLNSAILAIGGICLLLLVGSMAAYGLSRYTYKGRDLLQSYFLLGLMFPIQLSILPLFVMMRTLHLTNSLWGLVILYAANMSFAVFVFSKFFKTLPASMAESAKIDGASEFVIYMRVIMPLSVPVISTVGLINFISIWNDFYMPLVFLPGAQVRTLTLGLYRYMGSFLANWNLVFPALTIALIPVVVVFFMFSNQIVSGLTSGAIKE